LNYKQSCKQRHRHVTDTLQVEVARLTLELKEAEMQRDDAEAYKAKQQQTINSLQVMLRLGCGRRVVRSARAGCERASWCAVLAAIRMRRLGCEDSDLNTQMCDTW
jgi:hypothetical protein